MNHRNIPNAQLIEFLEAFLRDMGIPDKRITPHSIPGHGSHRLFWRITSSQPDASFIVMENAPVDAFSKRENIAYLKIGKHLFQRCLPFPEIHRFDLDNGWFIMEDMGDRSLQDIAGRFESRTALYEKVIEILFRLQMEGAQGLKTEWCCQTERYDHFVMRRYESDYFRDSFLCHYLGLKEEWPELEGPFGHLAETSSRALNHFFLHRDFQ